MNEKIKKLDCAVNSAAVFRELRSDDIINSLWSCLDVMTSDDTAQKVYAYSRFVSKLYKKNINLSEYILKAVLEDENFYIVGKAQGKCFDDIIEECVENELKIFQELSQISSDEIKAEIGYDGFLPSWKTSEIDFVSEYRSRIENIGRFGYGMYSKYFMFIVRDGKVTPVKHPDAQKLSDLYGYERERTAVINNTLALLSGRPAQNVLLYGDAGTGKSSTVKAIANEYASKGLRVIEVTKEQLRDIPHIIDSISKNPLKFILFIDDLSFTAGEDCFGALKATLEGSVSARADNIAIYATSNRRHLVKESFSDREGDDIHRNDTIQELISLSARFGLTVNFSKPDKKSYINIVSELARKNGIEMDENELSVKAEAFALRGSGRSARTAKQFVNQLVNEK
ncbi:MAG: ATP-binding protein [Ruminococcus sp.]|nr:ATP-binding protein [Ruminococcus sp.]